MTINTDEDEKRNWRCNKCDQEWYPSEMGDFHKCPDCGVFCEKLEDEDEDDSPA